MEWSKEKVQRMRSVFVSDVIFQEVCIIHFKQIRNQLYRIYDKLTNSHQLFINYELQLKGENTIHSIYKLNVLNKFTTTIRKKQN